MAAKGMTLAWKAGDGRLDDLLYTFRRKWDPLLPRQVGWHMAQAALKRVSSFKVTSHVH